METANYEPHNHPDPSFPVIFHLDTIAKEGSFCAHWHENLEILLVTEGVVSVQADVSHVTAKAGDMVVINSNYMHTIHSLSPLAKYHCLITDKNFCSDFGLYIEEITFQKLITDSEAKKKFEYIKNEIDLKKALYKASANSAITDLLIYLYRNFTVSESVLSNKQENIKMETIKKSIKFIQANYDKNITISDISDYVGLSKFYFCRTFKEITGNTVVVYINLLRCSHAKKLLQTGKYSVSETAHLSGFDNLSYFSKTYKKYVGHLPSSSKINGNPN